MICATRVLESLSSSYSGSQQPWWKHQNDPIPWLMSEWAAGTLPRFTGSSVRAFRDPQVPLLPLPSASSIELQDGCGMASISVTLHAQDGHHEPLSSQGLGSPSHTGPGPTALSPDSASPLGPQGGGQGQKVRAEGHTKVRGAVSVHPC